jgi:hypothetical protein
MALGWPLLSRAISGNAAPDRSGACTSAGLHRGPGLSRSRQPRRRDRTRPHPTPSKCHSHLDRGGRGRPHCVTMTTGLPSPNGSPQTRGLVAIAQLSETEHVCPTATGECKSAAHVGADACRRRKAGVGRAAGPSIKAEASRVPTAGAAADGLTRSCKRSPRRFGVADRAARLCRSAVRGNCGTRPRSFRAGRLGADI